MTQATKGNAGSVIRLPATARPILLVVVDTEEEFDWNGGFSREATSVTAVAEIHRFQQVCNQFGIRPVYLVDYPVASQAGGVGPLKQFLTAGEAEIGAHLHPWVNPPFDEPVNAYNSYPGNLEPELEAEKLRLLTKVIEEAFGSRPTAYKAGRYGIGPHTPDILRQQGFEIDLSPAPPMDFSDDGGPDFSACPPDPCWHGEPGGLLGVPSTGAYVGFFGPGAHRIYRFATGPALRRCHLPGILAWLRAVDRLRLSPEGYSLRENVRLTTALMRRGLRVFNFALHSPSMKPGCTPYVASEAERDRLLDDCRRYFEWFLNDLDGICMTPSELRRHVISNAEPYG